MSLMLPLPLGAQLEPGEATQVQVAPSRIGGIASVTVAPAATLGPTLPAVIV